MATLAHLELMPVWPRRVDLRLTEKSKEWVRSPFLYIHCALEGGLNHDHSWLVSGFGFPCIRVLLYAHLASLCYIIRVKPDTSNRVRRCSGHDCVRVLWAGNDEFYQLERSCSRSKTKAGDDYFLTRSKIQRSFFCPLREEIH